MASEEKVTSGQELLDVIEKVTEELQADVERYRDLNINEPHEVFWRRGLARACFAYFEGLISTLKIKSLLLHKVLQYEIANEPLDRTSPVTVESIFSDIYKHLDKARKGANFSLAELLLLVEWSYRLNEKGKVEYQKAKISLQTNLQFAFRMYAKATRITYALPRDEDGWNKFRMATKIRDRLTHPKKPTDLDMSEEDTRIVLDAYTWVFQCQIDLFKLAHGAKEKINQTIDDAPEKHDA